MATWILDGEVPDSDEEDLDETSGYVPSNCGHDGLALGHTTTVSASKRAREHEKDTSPDPLSIDIDPGLSSREPEQTNLSILLPVIPEHPPLYEHEDQPPASDVLFQDGPATTSTSCSILDLPLSLDGDTEEASISYVLLSSPLSSLSDLMSPSPPEDFLRRSSRSPEQGDGGRDTVSLETVNTPHFSLSDLEDTVTPTATRPRHFRQRAPIQLHPYALEGEKYRRTLMARGVQPLRLEHTQERTTFKPTTVYNGDQEFDGEGESQSQLDLSLQRDVSPALEQQQPTSSSRPSNSPAHHLRSGRHGSEEFPDIADLVDHRKAHLVAYQQNRRRTYHKAVSHMTPTDPPHLSRLHASAVLSPSIQEDDVFDFPASPPTTSPPLPRLNIRSVTIPDEVHSDLLEDTTSTIAQRSGLPTPVTSAAKTTAVSLSTEVRDEDTSESEASVVQLSSPGRSQSTRKVGQRIRGVLPASWLRLDKGSSLAKIPEVRIQESQSLSPERAIQKRGVAIPKARSDVTAGRVSTRGDSALSFAEVWGVGDDSPSPKRTQAPHMYSMAEDDLASHSEFSYALQDDSIDEMLPTRKRQTLLSTEQPRQKRRKHVHKFFERTLSERLYQPKITNHLPGGISKMISADARRSRKGHHGNDRKRTSTRSTARAPKLSVLDYLPLQQFATGRAPPYMRLAARALRDRPNLGRQSPSRKFVRLATREDTADAGDTLKQWRGGKIRQCVDFRGRTARSLHRRPLHTVSGNAAASPRLPLDTAFGRLQEEWSDATGHTGCNGKFDLPGHSAADDPRPNTSQGQSQFTDVVQDDPVQNPAVLRTAQLETLEKEHQRLYPEVAFRSTKRSLDTLYRKAHRGHKIRGEVQLAKFLEGGDHMDEQVSVLPSIEAEADEVEPMRISPLRVPAATRTRKQRTARRIDIGAARYRQPIEPLLLESIEDRIEHEAVTSVGCKLLGLGGFGTTYTKDFDIFPFQFRVFFQQTTFIGSGRLANLLKSSQGEHTLTSSTFRISGRLLQWYGFNADVSSDLGLVFDWMIERLGTEEALEKSTEILDCLDFVTTYIQGLTGHNENAVPRWAARLVNILKGAASQLQAISVKFTSLSAKAQRPVLEFLSRLLALIFFVHEQSKHIDGTSMTARELEELLVSVAKLSISCLLSCGLDRLRTLYDDLQYLTFREVGIAEESVTETWIIVIRVLESASIPRSGFWDILNDCLKTTLVEATDARGLERIWCMMFTLLPLFGLNSSGSNEHSGSTSSYTENWMLTQKLMKVVFTSYTVTSLQSPSFNDYIRMLFTRCHHLMQTWGWRRHSSIIGTMFDFFTSQNLSHLRNEESYESPDFLRQLDRDPTLDVQADDRCFHILLKIIALAITQMRGTDDAKSIRNLVARLLPNHNRQYLKEEAVSERELSSLRNHHDVLCTLFWAAPAESRPSVNTLRDLVDPARSHKEAYMISLRAWMCLSRFILGTEPSPSTYEPLARWQAESFAQLLHLYYFAGKEANDQFLSFSDATRKEIGQHHLNQIIEQNRSEIVSSIVNNLTNLRELISSYENMDVARIVVGNAQFTDVMLSTLTRIGVVESSGLPIIEAMLEILETYMTCLNSRVSARASSQAVQVDEDSQDYGGDVFDQESPRLEYIGEIDGKIKTSMRDLLRRCSRSLTPVKTTFLNKVVDTWALLAATLVMAGLHSRSDFQTKDEELLLDSEPSTKELGARFTMRYEDVMAGEADRSLTFTLDFE